MMAVAVIGTCLLLVPAVGGTWRALAELRLPFDLPILTLFLIQGFLRGRLLGARSDFGQWTVFAWACVCFALLLMVAFSWRRAGSSVLVLGLSSNLAVVLLNAGMPYVYTSDGVHSTASAFYHAANLGTRLVVLGDVLPDPSGQYLLSVGDLLLCIGAVTMVVAASVEKLDPVHR